MKYVTEVPCSTKGLIKNNMTKKIKEIINSILIRLTDITGFDDSSKALKAFDVAESQLEKIIELVVAEERERIRCNLPNTSASILYLLLDDYPNCGQLINKSFVDDLTCRIQDEYKQRVLSSLDKPLLTN